MERWKGWLHITLSISQKWPEHRASNSSMHVEHSSANKNAYRRNVLQITLSKQFPSYPASQNITLIPVWLLVLFLICRWWTRFLYFEIVITMFVRLRVALTSSTLPRKAGFLSLVMFLSSWSVLLIWLHNMNWNGTNTHPGGCNLSINVSMDGPRRSWVVNIIECRLNIVTVVEPSMICLRSNYYDVLLPLKSWIEAWSNASLQGKTSFGMYSFLSKYLSFSVLILIQAFNFKQFFES